MSIHARIIRVVIACALLHAASACSQSYPSKPIRVIVFATPVAAMAQIKAGRVKMLATSSPQRLPYLPDVPTFIKVGLAGIDVMPWQGFLAPANTSRAIITLACSTPRSTA